jgi:hypothetical protein
MQIFAKICKFIFFGSPRLPGRPGLTSPARVRKARQEHSRILYHHPRACRLFTPPQAMAGAFANARRTENLLAKRKKGYAYYAKHAKRMRFHARRNA